MASPLKSALKQRVRLTQPEQPRLSVRSARSGGGGGSVDPGHPRSVRLPGLTRPSEQTPTPAPQGQAPSMFKPHGGGPSPDKVAAASEYARQRAIAQANRQTYGSPDVPGANMYGGPASEDPAVTHAQQMLAMDAVNEPARKVAAAMQTIGEKMQSGAYTTPGPDGQPGMPNANAMMSDALQAGIPPQQLTTLISAMNFSMTAQTKAASGAMFNALGQVLNENPHSALSTEELFKATWQKMPPELRQYVDPKQAIDHLETFSHAMVGNVADDVAQKVQLGQMSPEQADKFMKPTFAKAVGAGLLDQKQVDTMRQQIGIIPPKETLGVENAASYAKGLAGSGKNAQMGFSLMRKPDGSAEVWHDDPTSGERKLQATFAPDGSFHAAPEAAKQPGFFERMGALFGGQGGQAPQSPAPPAAPGAQPSPPPAQPAQAPAPEQEAQQAQQAAQMAQQPGAAGGANIPGNAPAPPGQPPPVMSNQMMDQRMQQAAQPQPPAPPAGGASVKDMVNPQDPMKAKLLNVLGIE